jgi:DNA-binding CsgD family transcriptional regulator/tetratricopeptide (TPR) repeat protein
MQAPFVDPLSGLELLTKTLPLVGRKTEMQAIRSLLDTVSLNQSPGARALTIIGEIGIGKTRLLAEMYQEAHARGFRVLEGHTYEAGSMFPYLPFIEVLRPVLYHATIEERMPDTSSVMARSILSTSAADPSGMASLSGAPLVAALARLFPELPAMLHMTITPELLSPEQEKFRLFDAVATLLERLAMERPILLGIDNLQWADSGSLELTMYLTVRLHKSHVALVGIMRSPTIPNKHLAEDDDRIMRTANTAATKALSELMRQGLLLLMPLGPLDTVAAEQHLHALLPGTISQQVAQSLLSRAEGNPFFLEELVRTLALNRVLVRHDSMWKATRAINTQLPESITLAVKQRLQGLSEPCHDLLCTASLFGRTFPLDALVQVLELPEDDVESLLNEALQATLIAKTSDTGAGGDQVLSPAKNVIFMFCQGIVQEVLSSEVPTSRARQLHGAIGAALEASLEGSKGRPKKRGVYHPLQLRSHEGNYYAGAASAHAAELAHHYALSGNKLAALRWSLVAGEDAVRQQTHREAIRHFRLALRLLENGNVVAPLVGARHVTSPAQLHHSIGESWFKLGELEQATQAFQQVLAYLQDAALQANMQQPHETLDQPDTQQTLLLAKTNRLLADIYRMQGKYDQALAHLQAASSAFDMMAHFETIRAEASSRPSARSTQVPWFPGRTFPLATSTKELDIVSLQAGKDVSWHPSVSPALGESLLLLQARATLDMMLGRIPEAETELWQSHQLATQIGDRGSQAFALQLLGWLRGWGEHIHEAIRLQEQAHELYIAIGDPFRAALVDQVLGIVYQALGEMERARLCTLRGFERARRYGASRILGLLHWNFGVMALAQGDWAHSDSRLQQAWQEAETNNDARLKPVVLQAQAELQFRCGNWHEAEQLFQASIQAASTNEWIAGALALYGHFLAVTGHRKAAQEQLDRASACTEPPGLAGSFYIPFLAEGYIHLGANERAAMYIERIRSMQGCMYYGNAIDRILGVVATQAGDWEMAEQAFENGLALCRRANNEPEEAAIIYEQARIQLIAPTSEHSRENIHDLCDRAREIFLRYQMQRAANLVDTLQKGAQALEQHDNSIRTGVIHHAPSNTSLAILPGVSAGPRFIEGPAFSIQRLTGRELEVLRLVAEGHTDREVAETLVISPRTVNRHLSNIFVKLDVPGRAAAVAFAIRQGIVS